VYIERLPFPGFLSLDICTFTKACFKLSVQVVSPET